MTSSTTTRAKSPEPSSALRHEGVSKTDDISYFRHTRNEIRTILPESAHRILEIGCSEGHTLGWLKSKYFPNSHTTGIDGFAGNEAAISRNADRAIIADLNAPIPDIGRFDLILALDVLEHLQDADRVLVKLVSDHLAPGGSVVVSVPAISHLSVSLPLLLKREFTYSDAGILDRTHLRFFVEKSSVALMNGAGLIVDRGLLGGIASRKSRLFNFLTLGILKHWMTKQYIVRGTTASSQQSRVAWKTATYDSTP
jgi:2-polyprenyl-3-methyl-5-hydroxy-6-metoxy-1,4-benzoquinol methylase